MADEPVEGGAELAALASAAFRKGNEKKIKKAAKAEAAAAGGARKGFRATSGAARTPTGEERKAPKKLGLKKKEDGDDSGRAHDDDDDAPRRSKKKGGGGGNKNLWRYIIFIVLLCGGGLQVVITLFENLFSGASSGRASNFSYPSVSHVKLNVADPAQLQRVFFSGESWLVLCNNHTVDEPINVVFERTAALLHHTEKAAKAHHVFTALLPCHGVLPSGKNVYHRWDLPLPTTTVLETDPSHLPPRTDRDGQVPVRKHYTPTAFYVANGDKPKALAPSFFGHREKDDAITVIANKMAELVRGDTKPRNVVSITSSTHLTSYCTKKRHCALFLYQSNDFKMAPETREEINRLCGAYRSVRCASLDLARYKSSLQNALPALPAGLPSWPRLVLTKKLTEDELKKLIDDEAAAAPPPVIDPTDADAAAAEEANPSRTVNPKAIARNSIGVAAKAHRGAFAYDAMSHFIESVLGVSPAWPNAEEEPLRATNPTSVSAEDKKMTRLTRWPTVTYRPQPQPTKKLTDRKRARDAAKKAAAAEKEKAAKKASESDEKLTDEEKARRAANEAAARERMAAEEQERNPQAADEDDAQPVAEDEDAEENVDLDSVEEDA